jgi:hypothetical protein
VTVGDAYLRGFADGANPDTGMDATCVEEPLRGHYVHGFLKGFSALKKAHKHARELDNASP